MPVTMTCFTLAGLGLVGVPLFAGFVSKFMLGSAAAEAGGLGMLGVACLIISAFFTLFYMVRSELFALLFRQVGKVFKKKLHSVFPPGRGEGGFPLEYSL